MIKFEWELRGGGIEIDLKKFMEVVKDSIQANP